MNLLRSQRTRRSVALTPLVDIIFLLLMFFMLSSSFTKFAVLEISARQAADVGAAQAQEGRSAPDAAPGAIISHSSTRGLSVNGVAVAKRDLVDLLNQIHDKGVRSAVVMTDSGTTVQELVSTVELARRSRLAAITLAR